MQTAIRQSLVGDNTVTLLDHPFAVHAFLLTHVVEAFDRAVWSWRDMVRDFEKSRPNRAHDATEDFEPMHEIARHLIHCTEMLTTALSVVDSMEKQCRACSFDVQGLHASAILRELDFHASMLKSFLHRSKALEERMQNEINLVSTHKPSVGPQAPESCPLTSSAGIPHQCATRQLRRKPHRRCRSARQQGHERHQYLRDDLPAWNIRQRKSSCQYTSGSLLLTEIEKAIFSMSFFHFTDGSGEQSGHWAVSQEFWLYWAVAIPLTVFTLGTWHVWQRRSTMMGSISKSTGSGYGLRRLKPNGSLP